LEVVVCACGETKEAREEDRQGSKPHCSTRTAKRRAILRPRSGVQAHKRCILEAGGLADRLAKRRFSDLAHVFELELVVDSLEHRDDGLTLLEVEAHLLEDLALALCVAQPGAEHPDRLGERRHL